MAKKATFNYKAYLKVLGAISYAFGALAVLMAIIIVASKIGVDKLGLTEQQLADLKKIEGSTDDMVRAIFAVMVCIGGAWAAFVGWLMRRAAKTPEKSTFLLVLLVLSVIGGITSTISLVAGGKFNTDTFGGLVGLTIDVLALMSVVQLRKQVAEE